MLLTIPCKKVISKGGTGIYADNVKLTGFGTDEESALQDVRNGIIAWGSALQRQGIFRDALKRVGLEIEDDGIDELNVVLTKRDNAE